MGRPRKQYVHVHDLRCITDSWTPCPGLDYETWIAIASSAPTNRDDIWKSHEYYARRNLRKDDPIYIDLGGESG